MNIRYKAATKSVVASSLMILNLSMQRSKKVDTQSIKVDGKVVENQNTIKASQTNNCIAEEIHKVNNVVKNVCDKVLHGHRIGIEDHLVLNDILYCLDTCQMPLDEKEDYQEIIYNQILYEIDAAMRDKPELRTNQGLLGALYKCKIWLKDFYDQMC